MTKVLIEAKFWQSVLVAKPREGEQVKCLVISYGEDYAGYSVQRYQWWKGQWEPCTNSPALREGMVITHWLVDPYIYPPLPEGWPDCEMAEVDEFLKPYINNEVLCGTA